MKRVDKADDPQRRQLIEALGAGLFTAGLSVGNYAFAAKIFGDKPYYRKRIVIPLSIIIAIIAFYWTIERIFFA